MRFEMHPLFLELYRDTDTWNDASCFLADRFHHISLLVCGSGWILYGTRTEESILFLEFASRYILKVEVPS